MKWAHKPVDECWKARNDQTPYIKILVVSQQKEQLHENS